MSETEKQEAERRQGGNRAGATVVHELVQEEFSLVTQHMVMSEHLNPNHHIFGGQLLAWLDTDVYLHCTNRLRYKSMYGKKYFGIARTTFVIDAEGVITHVFEKVKVTGHAEAVLAALDD